MFKTSLGIPPDDFVWIGGIKDKDERIYFWEEKGEPMKYTNWAVGEPKNSEVQNCVNIDQKGWYNDYCQHNHYFICEITHEM